MHLSLTIDWRSAFYGVSIQVARLLAHCVLIGSFTELLFSFCMRSVLAFLQMVDDFTGKVMSSMVIILALKVCCNS
jgi:hypothetical protein